MDKKLNPLDWEIDLLWDTVSDIIRKLNPLTWRLELVYSADSYIQKINPFIWDFDMVWGAGASYIIKEATWSWYINLTNAVANHLMELKAYGWTEQRNDISCAQWPCPTGFHIPSKDEWVALVDTMLELWIETEYWDCMKTYMKMPFAGYRDRSSADVSTQDDYANYWSSTAYDTNSAYCLFWLSSWLDIESTSNRSFGQSIRAFKDTPVVPNSSWTTLYSWTWSAWVFHNTTEWLISISSDWTNWTTIMDKNLWATVVYNDEDTLSEANCWKYYQWWNNYGFAWTWNVTTSSTQVDASSYWPWNYYSSSTFITRSSSPYDWSSVQNDNLRWWVSVAATDPTPTVPMNIVCNNWALKFSKNMANVNTQTIQLWYYISSSWVVTADANNRIYKDYIPVQPNTTYTLTLSSSVYYVTISEYSTAEDSGFVRRNAGSSGSNTQLTITTGATTNYVRFWTNIDRTEITLEEVLAINWMLNQGNAMPYAPYSPTGIYIDWTTETIEDELWNTATAEMLLKIWDYADEQEILSWDITRKVGIMVLDWTENWQLATSTDLVQFYTSSTQGIIANNVSLYSTIAPYGCTVATRAQYDFGCYSWNSWNLCFQMKGSATLTTSSAWTQFLTDQYNAWTPVIVVYPLATPTTETVTEQTMSIQAWNNTIEITQASIDNLWLYAKYKATA